VNGSSDEQPLGIDAPQDYQSGNDQNQLSHSGVRTSLKSIFAWHNYAVYLVTSWIFSAFVAVWSFFNLYLRAIGWDYLQIGFVMAIASTTAALARIIGGYVGDAVDRKKLAVIAMFMAAVSHVTIGLFIDFTAVFAGLMIYSIMDIAKGGSSAYIMDNIPRQDSGFALSLFTAGNSFGILVLIPFGVLVPLVGFASAIRFCFVLAGLMFLVCTAARARLLTSSVRKTRAAGTPLWKDFLHENRYAVSLLLKVMPGVLVVVILDSFSDALFGFGALLYTNEYLGVSISGITVIVLVSLVASVPLLLKVGRFSDRRGVRKAAFAVYSVMPLCAIMIILAPVFPYWVPEQLVQVADSRIPGLGIVFTTPFLALVVKNINDILWSLVLLTLIQKRLPRQDTAKTLAVFWSIVYLFMSFGPFIGGLVFTYADPSQLFAIVLILNVIILSSIARIGLVGRNDEPPTSKEPAESVER
jgi:MFS family permease